MPLTDPVPSSSFDVLERNIQDTDKFVNQETGTFTNRAGKAIKPIPVIEAEALEIVKSIGWVTAGEFATGFTYAKLNDVGRDSSGSWWRYNGSDLPKVISAGTIPSSPNFSVISFESAYNVEWKTGKSVGYALDDYRGVKDELYSQAGIVDDGTQNQLGDSQFVHAMQKITVASTTTDKLALGFFPVGSKVSVSDRYNNIFTIESGGTANGIDILNAGVSKTAVSESVGTNSISLLAAGVKAGLMLSASAVENSNIIEYCLNNYDDAYWEGGAIWINRACKLNRQHQTIRGLNRDTCLLVPTTEFIPDTIGGATAKAAIWYQPAGTWNVNSGFVYGGSIRSLRIDCGVSGADGNTVEGIRTNRVITMLDIKDVFIWRPSIGVNATYANWGATLSNVTVIGAYEKSIHLGFASNGVIMTGCNLFGQDWVVPTHLHVETSSYGVEYNGGVIEGAQYCAFIRDRAQVKFTSVDFEVAETEFIHIEGSYTTEFESDGGTLTVVGPPSSVDTCTFVGKPSVAAVHTLDSQLTVSNSKFIPAEATGGVPCLLADRTGAKKGLVNQGILDINNDYSEWTLGTGGQVDTVFGERRGTWIPNISINGSSLGITYDIVNGILLQKGKEITAKFHIKLSNKGVNVGTVKVTGLTSLNRIGTDGGVVAYTGGLSAAIDVGMYGESGTTNIVLAKTATGGTTQLLNSDITNTFEIIGTYTYWIE